MKKSFTNPLTPFEAKWVALSPDRKRVVASGNTAKEVDVKLKKMKRDDAILTMVLPFDKVYSPHVYF